MFPQKGKDSKKPVKHPHRIKPFWLQATEVIALAPLQMV